MKIKHEKLLEMYRKMLLIRCFEESIEKLAEKYRLLAYRSLCVGQEAVAVGVCSLLRNDDYVSITHRGDGHWIAKGGSLKLLLAELLGRKGGSCSGKAGLYLSDLNKGILPLYGCVAAQLPVATGVALAIKLKKTNQVVVSFFGEGASNQGVFHEAINLASVWKLLIVYICENNLYALTTSQASSMNIKNVSKRASAYGIPGWTVDGMDVVDVYKTVSKAVERARKGKGPSLIECKTYRLKGAFLGGPGDYVPKEEYEKWVKKDPVENFRKRLLRKGILSEVDELRLRKEVEKEVNEAVKYAINSPWPQPEEALKGKFKEEVKFTEEIVEHEKTKKVTFSQAISEAIKEEMRKDQHVFLMGEDLRFLGGGFGVLKNLFKEFGPERVRDTPISEAGFVGVAVGAAMLGMRPIVEIMFADFLGVCMDQISNVMAMTRYLSNGKTDLPVVVRVAMGGGMSFGPQHSQCLYSWLTHFPGLKVVVPSTPFDAKGLLKTAIRDDDPVIFFEHKILYSMKDVIPEEEYTVPFGKAVVRREGNDVTIVATAYMVHKALSAAEKLEKEGVNVEVIDPRTLIPLDKETTLNSVKKTGRLVVVDEDYKNSGISAEIAALVVEEVQKYLKTSVKRLAVPDIPIPYSPPLEKTVIPIEEEIIETVKEIMREN
ncbi:dehydrogenase [Candidatus Bathyarchaeota archaeon]|nr:MAG: dehydrogenase [Candidatus Bathyarchaeota archaeon]